MEEARSKGIDDLDKPPGNVRDAAEAIGKRDHFDGLNKVLSKFAHPTAQWIFNEDQDLEGFREDLYDRGLSEGREALRSIKTFTSAQSQQ